jgi:hypothetical protein
MATITPPAPSRNLVESQQRVRHPLERIRGTIRTYVGLEGAALLITLVALWFWVSFVLDFGPFRAFEWDWVQDVPYRWARALALGGFFLCAVILLRVELILRLYGGEMGAILRTAFATSTRRQTLPVWLRLPLVGAAVSLACWGAEAAGTAIARDDTTGVLVGEVVAAVVAFVITGTHELFGVTSSISRWVRACATAVGAAAGALLGAWLGYAVFGGTISAIILSGLLAIVGDVFALVNIGVIAGMVRGQGYLVALTVPCVVAYLLGWLVAALAAAVSPWLAGGIIVLLMVGPVLFVTMARLTRDFSSASLALVLERRFPEVLGDRLITAVELADPKKAARYGYSEVMIVHTIHDAADRVQTVPVSDVFNWKRLGRYWFGVAWFTLGLYVFFGGLFCIPAVGETGAGERAGYGAFHQAAGLALERNLLLQNVIWPRRAFLEILDWPESGNKFVGKDDSALSVKVRAYRWVIADPKSPLGWRALAWHDLEKNHGLLGSAAPMVNFRENDEQGKKDWGQPRDPAAGWTLDEIETRLGREETHVTSEAETVRNLRDTLARLAERASDPAMRRSLRMLLVPVQVTVRYRGLRGGGELTLQRQGDNEYSGQFPDLKETVTFTARGEDYETPRYRITVVPPPSLVEMTVDEQRPAYMFYRVRGGDPGQLRGLKQAIAGRPVSVSGGDTSRVEGVPAGSNLVLFAKSDKELKSVMIDEPRKGAAPVKGDVQLLDPHRFTVRFDDVRTTLDFYFSFLDTENVKGERHVIIKPQEDLPPEVNIDVKVIRKTSQGYMVTASAYIPLEAKVSDDRGLYQVEYGCAVTKLDRQAEQSGRGLLVLSAMHLLPGGPGQELLAASRIAALSRESKTGPKGSSETGPQHYPALTFQIGPDEYLPLEKIQENVGKPRPLKMDLKRDFLIDKLDERDIRNKDTDPPYFFNIDQVKNAEGKRLKVESRDEIQPRYRLQLWMEAVDTDIETGREVLKTPNGVEYRGNRGRSKETLTFIVVPENELLAEIAKEEDQLYIKLGEQIKRLKDGLDKLDDMKKDLTVAVKEFKADGFVAMQARGDELALMLDKGESTCNEVSSDYQRILKELVTNRVDQSMIDRVQKQIVEPLNVAVFGDEIDKQATDTFPKVKVGIDDLKKAVGSEVNLEVRIAQSRSATDEARLRLNGLIRRLSEVLDKMEALGDLNKLKKTLKEIEDEENRQKAILKVLSDQIRQEILDSLGK